MAALRHELEDAKKAQTSEATTAQVADLRAQLQRKTEELQRKTEELQRKSDELAAAVSKSAPTPASVSAAAGKKPGAMPVRPGVHDTPTRAPSNQALVAAQVMTRVPSKKEGEGEKKEGGGGGGGMTTPSLTC